MTTAAIMLEGGKPPRTDLNATMVRLRSAAALDTLDRLRATPGIDQVLLATNRPELAAAAMGMGVAVWETQTPFDFSHELPRIIQATGADAVIYLGGVAVPLLPPADWAWVVDTLQRQAPCVVVNNPQSADLVAWSPASALDRVPLGRNDNFLGYLLRHEAGLERHLLPNTAAAHFDLDTPTDYLVLAHSGQGGQRTRSALADLDWDGERVRAIAGLLRQDLSELALVGRVGTAVVEYINRWLRLRLRVFSEERGMKALGRAERGEVVSLMALLMAEVGPQRFFHHLAGICHGACIDSRVLFAHGGRRVGEADRFYSDLGQPSRIRDPWVRAYTEAALTAPVPILSGGHSMVAGGLWLLAEDAVAACAARGGSPVSYR